MRTMNDSSFQAQSGRDVARAYKRSHASSVFRGKTFVVSWEKSPQSEPHASKCISDAFIFPNHVVYEVVKHSNIHVYRVINLVRLLSMSNTFCRVENLRLLFDIIDKAICKFLQFSLEERFLFYDKYGLDTKYDARSIFEMFWLSTYLIRSQPMETVRICCRIDKSWFVPRQRLGAKLFSTKHSPCFPEMIPWNLSRVLGPIIFFVVYLKMYITR